MRRMWAVSLVIGLLLCWATSANAATSLGIDVLSNRADVISAGDALVEVRIPGGRERREGPRVRRRPRRDERLRGASQRPLRGSRGRLVARPERAHRACPRCEGSARRRHEPPQRRSGVLGPAGSAVGLPVHRSRLAVQPAGELRVPLQDHERLVRRLRPGQPAVRRRRHHHRPGQDGPLHRPGRDRLPGPRPVQDRGPVRPVQAMDGLGSADAVEPQAPDHAWRELRDRAPGRLGA